MTRRIRFTLLGDGSSDKALMRHVEWLVRENIAPDVAIDPQWADLRAAKPKPEGLHGRIERAVELYPCDVLFVHRDAEKDEPEKRFQEIAEACDGVRVGSNPVPVVPVRMSEAWLLCDEKAIRKAAGNPTGEQRLDLPKLKDVEGLTDPKSTLQNVLRSASGLTGRRLRAFSPRARLVADNITDFVSLRRLSAFQRLESDVQRILAERGLLRNIATVQGAERQLNLPRARKQPESDHTVDPEHAREAEQQNGNVTNQ